MADLTQEKFENDDNNEIPFWANIFKKRDSSNYDILKILHKIPIFSTLTKREVKKVSLIVYERNYKAGEFLFKEGNPGSGMFIIQDGAICIERTSETGANMCLANLGAGDFLGELSLLDDSARSASARCNKNTRVIAFFREDLFDLIAREALLGTKILRELAMMIGARLRETNKSMHKYKKLADDQKKNIEQLEEKIINSNKIILKYKKLMEQK